MSVATKERPILMSAPMVKALLEGRKTQTRRVMKQQPSKMDVSESWHESLPWAKGCVGSTHPFNGSRPARWFFFGHPEIDGLIDNLRCRPGKRPSKPQIRRAGHWLHRWHKSDVRWSEQEVLCLSPYGQPGDRLWVKETWALVRPSFDPEAGIIDEVTEWEGSLPKSPPPGWAVWYAADSDDISHHRDDRWVKRWRPSIFMPRWASRITLEITDVRVERLQAISEADVEAEGCDVHFGTLWDSINGLGSWNANPWVWALTFRRVEG